VPPGFLYIGSYYMLHAMFSGLQITMLNGYSWKAQCCVKSTCNYYLQKSVVMSWSAQLLQLACNARVSYRDRTRQAHHSHPTPCLSCSRRVSAGRRRSTPTPPTSYGGGGS